MFSPLSLCIAGRFNRGKKRNSMLSFISISSIFGIALGVCVVIVGLSAMNGFERELKSRVLGVIPHGEMEAVTPPLQDWQQRIDEVKVHPHIINATPYVNFIALAEKGKVLKALQVKGVIPQLEQQGSLLPQFVTDNGWHNLKPDEQSIVLGQGVAKTLGVSKGDWLTLMIPQDSNSGRIVAPKRVRLQVIGLISLGGQIDHNLALIPLQDAQRYAGLGNGVSGIELRVDNVFNINKIVREAGNQLPVHVYLRSWLQDYGYLYRDIQMIRTIMYLVMVLVIGVASFNIVSTLMMAVKDRASDIAILRTMGASNGTIRAIFIWQGLLSGLLGCLFGAIAGVSLALNLTSVIRAIERALNHQFLSSDLYFIDFLPSQLQWPDVVIACVTALALSLLATWYPANRANRLQPARVLSAK